MHLAPIVEYLILTAPHAIGQAVLIWNDRRINRARLVAAGHTDVFARMTPEQRVAITRIQRRPGRP